MQESKNAAMHYEVLIIGSGQGGSPLAQAFANAGHTTALIESTHVGGTCVNEGCTPTKTMVASGRTAYMVCGAKAMGIEFKRSSVRLNFEKIRQRKRDIVDLFRGGSESRVQNTHDLDLIMGKARFVSSNEVEVTLNATQEIQNLKADKIFINAGCSPAPLTIPDSEVIEPANLLTSTSIMELDEVPRHLLIVGGGPIGLEFAQLFRRFGSSVSIVARSAHLLPNEDTEVSIEMEKILTEDGIKIYTGAKPQWFSKVPTGSVVLQIKTSSDETKSIFASHVLNATGRLPNTEALNLQAAGINTDNRGFIKVNDHLETSAPDIYALGDIKGGPAFTHISYDDFRILKHNLITHSTSAPLSIANRLVPYCIFTDPQLGRIGLTEAQARKLYPGPITSTTDSPAKGTNTNTNTNTLPAISPLSEDDRTPTLELPDPSSHAHSRIATSTLPMTSVARPLETGESRGLMKAVIDRQTDAILGFACLGVEGGEVMSVVQMAMRGGLKWQEMRDGVFAHPLLSEGLNGLFGGFGEE